MAIFATYSNHQFKLLVTNPNLYDNLIPTLNALDNDNEFQKAILLSITDNYKTIGVSDEIIMNEVILTSRQE